LVKGVAASITSIIDLRPGMASASVKNVFLLLTVKYPDRWLGKSLLILNENFNKNCRLPLKRAYRRAKLTNLTFRKEEVAEGVVTFAYYYSLFWCD
jgi:hypothetical protein